MSNMQVVIVMQNCMQATVNREIVKYTNATKYGPGLNIISDIDI